MKLPRVEKSNNGCGCIMKWWFEQLSFLSHLFLVLILFGYFFQYLLMGVAALWRACLNSCHFSPTPFLCSFIFGYFLQYFIFIIKWLLASSLLVSHMLTRSFASLLLVVSMSCLPTICYSWFISLSPESTVATLLGTFFIYCSNNAPCKDKSASANKNVIVEI